MLSPLSRYLSLIRENLRLDRASEDEVIDELEAHVEDKVEELKEAGISEDEAVRTSVRLLGSAKTLAHQIYEAHSQGSWRLALVASLPHLLFAAIFVLNWWRIIDWWPAMLVVMLTAVIYGWFHDKPTWVFPLLGYSSLPVVAAGTMLLYLPARWSWLAIVVYVPLAIVLLSFVTVQTVKKDWVYALLSSLPIPIIASWFMTGGLWQAPGYGRTLFDDFAPLFGINFLLLALGVVTFVRARQRWVKVTVLVISALFTLVVMAFSVGGRLGIGSAFLLILLTSALFMVPLWVERWLRYVGEHRTV